MAENYTMLEELGSKSTTRTSRLYKEFDADNDEPGGSFGVVYKAIDKLTGELVAIKHVSLRTSDDVAQSVLDAYLWSTD